MAATALGKVVAVIGDSTFLHSGITGLLDVAYNRGACTIIILDNWTTAMTGRQDHPGTGMTIKGDTTSKVDYVKLAKALGIKHIKKVDPFNLKKLQTILRREVNRPEPSVIIIGCALRTVPQELKNPARGRCCMWKAVTA